MDEIIKKLDEITIRDVANFILDMPLTMVVIYGGVFIIGKAIGTALNEAINK